ncbi:oligogalacturonate lyase family protein [Luteolibacter sp. Y139]|uniref:Oligogalacturonate lyase family protein n=2 Tax=Luteolibacter soli TaxID=3135280 RepID=A0ABU9B380_9BACT
MAVAQEEPKSWVDPDTGHKVIQLTKEPGSASLYFNENGYTPDGKRMIYTTPGGISLLDLTTFAAKQVVQGDVRAIAVGRKTPTVFYVKRGENALYSTQMDTGETRKIGDLPKRGRIATINADETLAAGTYVEGEGKDYNEPRPGVAAAGQQGHSLEVPPNKGEMMEERLAAKLPMAMFTMDLRTGESRPILHSTDWLNHLLFSPTDPAALMYCHEGPWQKVDRIWTIRADGSGNTLVHKRTMAMEIAGHEFWSADGKTIWYDLQVPKGQVFYVAGYQVETGERTWYHLDRNEWSIHFNTSRDGSLFCGDGGDSGQVAKAPDGRWIYLFRPEMIHSSGAESAGLVRPGVFRAEKLVNMSKHDYKLEPNVSFTPDGKMIVFRSNMLGDIHVYGVKLE